MREETAWDGKLKLPGPGVVEIRFGHMGLEATCNLVIFTQQSNFDVKLRTVRR